MCPRCCKLFEECHQKAVYVIPHSKLAFCKDHFLQNVENRVKKTIEKKHMFHPNRDDKVLVAMSGGKDSQVLMYILKKLYPEDPIFEGLYVELGISSNNYSEDSGVISREFCENLGVPFHIINIKEHQGFNIDEIHEMKEKYRAKKLKQEKNQFRGECSYCGMFKRYYINKFATDNKFDVVATGHNLTDEATSLMNNFFNMDLMFLTRSGPTVANETQNMVPRVKPLFFISEEEIMMYAYYAGIPHLPTECPYSLLAPNLKIKKVLQEIEETRRGNMIGMVRRYHKVMQPVIKAQIPTMTFKDRVCNNCGMPSLAKTCFYCKTISDLEEKFEKIGKN